MKRFLLLFLILTISISAIAQNQIIKDISVLQCDSLISANENNPNFVVLDVRTPKEYNPQHILGAITRNFYDADFNDQLDLLNKDKLYLIHCQSGGRSGSALNAMKSLGFKEVYNMLGGMSAWKRKSLATTDQFSARIMFVSDSIVDLGDVEIGDIDTLIVTITNRANDLLTFTNLTHTGGVEFTTDFDTAISLRGAEDYSFDIYFRPVDNMADIALFTIRSNVGNINVEVKSNGVRSTSTEQEFNIDVLVFPNPATDIVFINGLTRNINRIDMVNANGKVILTKSVNNAEIFINTSNLVKGIYFINNYANGQLILSKKLLVK